MPDPARAPNLIVITLIGVMGCSSVAPLSDQPVADFALLDVNPASPSAGAEVSPRDAEGRVSLWFFGHATCAYCGAQFERLDALRQEVAAADPPLDVAFFGVNEAGHESGNDTITEGLSTPWLQDTEAVNAWEAWSVEFRDVVILDDGNVPIAVMNLTYNDLNDPQRYDELWRTLEDAVAYSANEP